MRLSDRLEWRLLESQGDEEDQSTLLRTLEEQHHSPFPDIERWPPWRMVCVELRASSMTQHSATRNCVYVIFAVHHSIADGVSAATFHSHLLQALNTEFTALRSRKQEVNSANDILTLPSIMTLAPPAEDAIQFKISWPFFLKTLFTEFAPSWRCGRQHPPPWTGKPSTLEPSRVNIRLVEISSEVLCRILAACRTHLTTLTPLIHAVVLSSPAKHVPEIEAESFVAQTPINLRRFMNTAAGLHSNVDNHMGVYLTSREHTFDDLIIKLFRDSSDDARVLEAIWSVAKTVKADLQDRLATSPNDDKLGLLSWVSDWHARWLKMLGRPRETTWELSNIGSMSGRSDTIGANVGNWKISQAVFTQSANVAGPAFSVNISGVKETGTTIAICWQESIVEDVLMYAVAGDLYTWLHKVANNR